LSKSKKKTASARIKKQQVQESRARENFSLYSLLLLVTHFALAQSWFSWSWGESNSRPDKAPRDPYLLSCQSIVEALYW